MSTRATYEIDGRVFYIHHDGYAAGAAFYFAKMVDAMNVAEPGERASIDAVQQRRGGAAFAFIRGNLNAEPAYRDSHDGHGDTEHRWRVTSSESGRLMLQHAGRRADLSSWTDWSEAEPLVDFIKRNGNRWEGAEPAPAIVAITDPSEWMRGREILASLPNAIAIAAAHHALAERFGDGNPNKATHAGQAEAWSAAIAEELQPRISYLVKRKAELLADLGTTTSDYSRRYLQLAVNIAGAELEQLAGA